MKRLGLCLEPLDVLFFRDGRPFGAASRVTSGLPTPQVLAGAVRTVLLEKYGCSFDDLARSTRAGKSFAEGLPPDRRWIAEARFRGPWLCKLPAANEASVPNVFLPVPATVQTGTKGEGDTVKLLKPLQVGSLPGWQDPLRPLWLPGTQPTEAASGFVDNDGLVEFLAGEPPGKTTLHPTDEFYTFDHRTGIGIDADKLVTGEGEIYGISFLSLKKESGFYAEIVLPDGAPDALLDGVRFLAFGGEGKRVGLRQVKAFAFPSPPEPITKQKRFVFLTTPCVTDSTGVPYSLRERVVAAAVSTPLAISGWDVAKGGPKPTRFAAPAGSVYFLDDTQPVPDLTDEFGYGCHLQGVWTDV